MQASLAVCVMTGCQVHKSLRKLIFFKREGFCWEINFCFAWLLRSLKYKVRIAVSHVITPGGPIPGHLVLLVDGLESDGAILVDPGERHVYACPCIRFLRLAAYT